MLKTLSNFKIENKFLEDYKKNIIIQQTWLVTYTGITLFNILNNITRLSRDTTDVISNIDDPKLLSIIETQDELRKMIKLCYENQKILFEHSVVSNKACLEKNDKTKVELLNIKKDISRLTQLFLDQIYSFDSLQETGNIY